MSSPARLTLIWGLLLVGACAEVEERVIHRESCLVCHRPRGADGKPAGIADPHPWHELSCTECHGGNGRDCDGVLVRGLDGAEPRCDGEWVYDQRRAHVSPQDAPVWIKDLTAGQLDDVDRAYVRFINPGDLRAVGDTCARCHTNVSATVRRSSHAHTAGEVAVARYRAGAQPTPTPIVAAIDVTDPARPPGDACAVSALTDLAPPPIVPGSTDPLNQPTPGNAHEQVLVKACLGCHISSFGPNDGPGRYRSSGCTACHMPYAEDGLSRGDDPWVDRATAGHPERHQLVTLPPMESCLRCHTEGARIGLSYRGWRERGAAGTDPPTATTLGRPLYGHDADHYLLDEDGDAAVDETPPDVHFEAGMTCIDCHTRAEVHGDNHLRAGAACVVGTRCEDCHGTVREPAAPTSARPHVTARDGELWLQPRLGGEALRVPQIAHAVDADHPAYDARAAAAMGVSAAGFSHTDDVACATCHSGWMPSCYGCHAEIDLSASAPYLTTGEQAPGAVELRPGPVALRDLVLMRDTRGRLAPSMPGARLFLSLVEPDAAGGTRVRFADRPRAWTWPDGRRSAAFGQRAVDPHTTRRTSPFAACDRCHSVGDPAAPDNAVLLDLTHGFGTERFLQPGCDVTNDDPSCDPETDRAVYRLDAIQTRAGEPLVVVGHELPEPSRPLTLDEIERMRQIVVPAETEVPVDAATNPAWP